MAALLKDAPSSAGGQWGGVIDEALKRFCRKRGLSEGDLSALRRLPFQLHAAEPRAYLVDEGSRPEMCQLLISGFTFRQKATSAGMRQILGIQMPGDFVDIQNLFLNVADHNLQALTRITVARVSRAVLLGVLQERAELRTILWRDSLVEASMYREWMLNVGRRDAQTRVAHLLCEFVARLRHEEEAEGYSYRLPLSQEQLADATGLTSVHVNRVLQQLGRAGAIRRERRDIKIEDWAMLAQIGDFRDRYLHLTLEPS